LSFDLICQGICAYNKFVPQSVVYERETPLCNDDIWLRSCFPTTIYDVMKRIRSASESFLPFAASSFDSHSLVPSLVLIWLFGQSLPVSSYLHYLFHPPFSPIDFLDFSRTKRTDLNFAIPRGFIYSSPSFASSVVRFVGNFTILVPATSVRVVWQVVTCNSCSCHFLLLSMQDVLESLCSKWLSLSWRIS